MPVSPRLLTPQDKELLSEAGFRLTVCLIVASIVTAEFNLGMSGFVMSKTMMSGEVNPSTVTVWLPSPLKKSLIAVSRVRSLVGDVK